MEIIKTSGQDGIKLTSLELETIRVKPGQKVSITKWVNSITPEQLRFVHAYFRFCIKSGGDQAAHYDAHAFWTDAKGWLKLKYPHDKDYAKITLSNMKMIQLEKILRVIDLELMQEKLEIDTSKFWCDYENYKNSGTEQPFSEWIAESY
jgi:hypothetical protein